MGNLSHYKQYNGNVTIRRDGRKVAVVSLSGGGKILWMNFEEVAALELKLYIRDYCENPSRLFDRGPYK